jgi:hypothetical protein
MAKEAYGLGIPMRRAQSEAIMPGLRQSLGGELPSYMENAFDAQRTGIAEGITAKERQQIGAQDMAAKGAVRGGNLASAMNPAQMGSALADAMMGSRVNQGMATINQANTLMSMGLGGAAQTGNQAVGAAGQQLQAISMLPNYNPTYAAVLGGVNAAGAIYGAGKQGGWWGGGNTAPAGTPPSGTPYWYGGVPSTYGSGV